MVIRSRRTRRIFWSIGGAAVFLIAALAVVYARFGTREIYRPGGEIAGLTSALDRSVPDDAPTLRFTDVAAASGIAWRHFPAERTTQLPEDMGSGAAWGDYDADGWPDLYLVNIAGAVNALGQPAGGAGRDVLYRNLGDGTFADVTEQAGIALSHIGSAAAWGDCDADGLLDLAVTAYGHNTLLHQQPDGRFAASTLPGGNAFWAGASWSDYDRDGDLDLYVTAYVDYRPGISSRTTSQYNIASPASINPSTFSPVANVLLRNDGRCRFTDVAESAGVANAQGRSLSGTWADFDGDGWPDLYVANDVSDNMLFWNRGNGTFDDISHWAAVADYRGAMGLAVGDWDADDDLDLFITHWVAQENALYNNLTSESADRSVATGPRFMDVADRVGLGQIALDYVGWGTGFFDADLDGREDLFIANGSTLQMPDRPESLIAMQDLFFWNAGPDRGFFSLGEQAGPWFAESRVGRGAAAADYDRDGDMDLVVVNHGGDVALLRNDSPVSAHWLGVHLDQGGANARAFGARVRVYAGGRVQMREIGAQASYLSQHEPVALFGLGAVTTVDSVAVTWPNGERQVFDAVNPDAWVTLQRRP